MALDNITFAAITGTVAGAMVGVSLIVLCNTFLKGYIRSKLRQLFPPAAETTTKEGDKPSEQEKIPSDETSLKDMPSEAVSLKSCPGCRKISTLENPCGCEEDETADGPKPSRLQFSLYYNFHDSHLFVHIICALGIPMRWYGKSPDTQVRLQLLPDIEHIYQTEIRTNESQPIFNETFEFIGYSERDLLDLTLRIGLYSFDKFRSGKMLGYTTVLFRDIDWHPGQATILWRNLETLQSRERSMSFAHGELSVSLRYEAQANRISAIVLKGIGLPRVSKVKSTAPYCQVILSIDDKTLETRQTKKKRSLNPVWNQGFIFDVDADRIDDYVITFRVMNYDLLLSDDVIGEVVISSRATGTAREHWDEMIKKKYVRREIAMTHGLDLIPK